MYDVNVRGPYISFKLSLRMFNPYFNVRPILEVEFPLNLMPLNRPVNPIPVIELSSKNTLTVNVR